MAQTSCSQTASMSPAKRQFGGRTHGRRASAYRSTADVPLRCSEWQRSADTRRSRGLPQIAAVDPNGPCLWLSRFWASVSNSATSRMLSDYRVAVQRVRGVDVECGRPFTAIHSGRGGSLTHCDDRWLDPFVDIRTVGTLDDVDTVSEDTDRQMGLRPALHDQGEQQRTDMPQRQPRRIGACFVADGRRFERRTL
jgi:hypothetical protein